MADLAIVSSLFLAERVLNYLEQEANLQKNVRDEVEDVTKKLRTMQAYLRDMEGNESNEVLKERVKQVRDVAYDIEDVLDEFMLHLILRFHRHKLSKKAHEVIHGVTLWIPLHEMSSKIKDIERKIKNITALDPIYAGSGISTILEKGPSSDSRVLKHPLSPRALDDDEIVGFEQPRDKLIRQLIEGESRHMTISVVGPCGSGKTTLVRNVYECKRVREWFDCHAWLHVSRSSKIEELLCSMLNQFCASTEEPIPHEGADTKAKLRYYLQQKRYVVVLDDIWSIEDWECIQNVLPIGGSSSSRIIVTTLKLDVASFCVESSHCIHHLTHLPRPVAWDLFCKKAFRNNNGKCPPELEEWSQKIVKRCEGLPLAIVAVGSLLSKKQQFPAAWKKMHDSLLSEIGTSSSLSIISKLLPSYKEIPINLKSCFLYFSIFPEGYSIKRGRLIRLWVAEGFVTKTRSKTLEEVAEDYLNELIGRNLVQASRRDVDGRVRSCRVLYLVREFTVLTSEEENFVSVFTEPDTSSGDKIRRLSIHNGCTTLSQSRRFSCVRSTFLFRWDNFSLSQIRNILCDFKLLRVLDMQDAPLDKFPEDIVRLTLLRYLSLR